MERTSLKRLFIGYMLIFLIPIIFVPTIGVVLFGIFFVPVAAAAIVAEAIRLIRSAFTTE